MSEIEWFFIVTQDRIIHKDCNSIAKENVIKNKVAHTNYSEISDLTSSARLFTNIIYMQQS